MMDRLIGLLGLAVTLIAAFAPLRWPQMPEVVSQGGVMLGVLLMGLAVGLMVGDLRAKDPASEAIWTSLKLQFFGDHRIPTEVVKQNVDSWYALWTESRIIDFTNSEGAIVQTVSIPKQWVIFIQFEKPTSYREVIVSFGIPEPPMHEVKTTNKRYVVVFISSDVPPTTLEIYTKAN